MKIKVIIDGVDGETFYTFGSPSADRVLEHLDKHDHEGSSIQVELHADDSEEVYTLLHAVRAMQVGANKVALRRTNPEPQNDRLDPARRALDDLSPRGFKVKEGK